MRGGPLSFSFSVLGLFLLLGSFGPGPVEPYYYGKITDCQAQNLSKTGKEMMAADKIILIQVLAGTHDPICMGVRPDWREGLPQCFQQMTGMDVYASQAIGVNETFMCTSCETLQEVVCEEVFKREIGALIVIGGGNKNKEGVGMTCEGVTLYKDRPIPRPKNITERGPRFSDACILKDSVVTRDNFKIPQDAKLVWFPMVQNTDLAWGMLERGRVYSEDGEQQWIILNDYHFPKISPVFPPPPTPTPPEMVNYTHPPKQDNLFLYISRVDAGKGHASFLNHLLDAPKSFRDNKFRFYIGGSKNTSQYQTVVSKISRANFLYNGSVEMVNIRLNREGVAEDMRRARGLIHMADTDRNPRIIYESLQEGLPVITSVQSMTFQGLECAPASVVRVVDSNAPSCDVGNEFQEFMRGTSDRRRARDHISKVVEALDPTSTYPCMCSALDICEEGTASEEYNELKAVYRTPDLAQRGLQLPKTCHLGVNFEGIQCDNSEIFSCLRWASWIERHRGTSAYLFTSKLQKRTFSVANFLSFSRKSCYIPEHRKEFFSLLYPLQPPQVREAKEALERQEIRDVMTEMRDWMVKMEGKLAKEEVYKREIVKKLTHIENGAKIHRRRSPKEDEEEGGGRKEEKKEIKEVVGKKEEIKEVVEKKVEEVLHIKEDNKEKMSKDRKIQMMEDKIRRWHDREKEREQKEVEHEKERQKLRQEREESGREAEKRYHKILEVAKSELEAEKELQEVNQQIQEENERIEKKKQEGLQGEMEALVEELEGEAELGFQGGWETIGPLLFFGFGCVLVVFYIRNILFKSDQDVRSD